MAFEIGQLVICIDDGPLQVHRTTPSGLVKGHIYTIQEIGTTLKGGPGVFVCEAIRPPFMLGAWGVSRFRPLSSSRLEVFREMLVNVPKEVVE